MVSTYPEDRSHALKAYQEHQQVGRVAHQAPSFEIADTIISRLRRPIRLEPSRWRVLARPSAHALCHPRRNARHGDNKATPRRLNRVVAGSHPTRATPPPLPYAYRYAHPEIYLSCC
eukprot:scaffold21536_cov39-Phaeocystis_antarctica.AAC.3